jgi:hypothetical protein
MKPALVYSWVLPRVKYENPRKVRALAKRAYSILKKQKAI